MKHIGCFSGGKDSTALMLWMRENIGVPGVDWTPVFCDTGWEHPITYAYVQEINAMVLNGSLVTLRSEKYFLLDKPNAVGYVDAIALPSGGFVRMCVERHAIPAVKSRFCTGELKVFPLHAYYESLGDEVTSHQGIRSDESASRASMRDTEWVEDVGGYWIKRPLLHWTAEQCFDKMREHGVRPNPLYLMGSTRVGCWPCIMTGLAELKRAIGFFPELKQRLIDLEKLVNESDTRGTRKWAATFFAAGTIPDRFCNLSQEIDCRQCNGRGSIPATDIRDADIASEGRHSCNVDSTCCRLPCRRCRGTGKYIAYVPTAEDVFRYIESVDENQLPLLPARSCMSVYNLCE